MRATLCIPASTQEEARVQAIKSFAEFYGDRRFRITSERARATEITMSLKVLVWECDFTAEEAA